MYRCFLFLIGLLSCVPLLGESISGKLTGSNGEPVTGAHLFLSQDDERVITTVTGSQGNYFFANLEPGHYFLRIRELGFQQRQIDIEVSPGEDVEHNVQLQLELLREEVTVTATRNESPTSLLGSSVTVITSQEIRAQGAASVAEVLRNVPALHITQAGGPGSLTSIFLRGGESDYTKVLLDGIPLNQPGGAVNLSNLSTANIDRIEIVRGPQSALYGSDAISGVIQIFTRKGTSETAVPRLSGFFEGGTYDAGRGGIGLHGRTGRIAYTATFEHVSTQNRIPNDYFHNNTFSTSIDIETATNSTLSLVGRLERGRAGVPGQKAFGSPEMEEFFRKRDFVAGASWDHRISDSWQHTFSYAQAYVNQLSVDPIDSGTWTPEFQGRQAPFPAFDFPFSFLDTTRKHTFNYQSDFFVATHMLSGGFEWEEQEGTVGAVRADRTNLAYYFQDQFLITDRLAVTGGLRLEDHDSFGFAATPRISAAYLLRHPTTDRFWGRTRAKFHFGTGIKEPTFVESFSENPFFRGNPNLEPERSTSFEVGLEQVLAGDLLVLEVNSFYDRFNDQIAFQLTDAETFEGSFFNIAQSQVWGLEHILGVRPNENIRLSAGYTYLNTRVLDSPSPFQTVFQRGAPLLRRPTHSGFLAITWTSRQWILNTNATVIGERADSDFLGLGLSRVEGFTKWDFSASYRVRPNVELYVRIENLLNQNYFEILGFPALKFNFRSGLRVNFGR